MHGSSSSPVMGLTGVTRRTIIAGLVFSSANPVGMNSQLTGWSILTLMSVGCGLRHWY